MRIPRQRRPVRSKRYQSAVVRERLRMWRGIRVWGGLALGQMWCVDTNRRATAKPRNSGKERPRGNGSASQVRMRVECELNRDETLPSELVRFGMMLPPEGRFRTSEARKKRRSDGREQMFRLLTWKSSTFRRYAKHVAYTGLNSYSEYCQSTTPRYPTTPT